MAGTPAPQGAAITAIPEAGINNMNSQNLIAIGQHSLLDLYGINADLACNTEKIEVILRHAAKIANATVLQSHFHSFGLYQGVTGVLLLSESHMSIHTWPEYQFAAIDIFMCGEHQIEVALSYLQEAFEAEHSKLSNYSRGIP
ncbi:adenosylmethionine decarboxylase [Alkanindiges illinoisensis]|uniref:adenosylmethionine decarboxylase n=1 Tax=Alkanindiges illinoisensis TaxID=197183 RepID=UPI001B80698C|nr:adenosylmethionine decarboxylase [Alkanindiges illinoisensis]